MKWLHSLTPGFTKKKRAQPERAVPCCVDNDEPGEIVAPLSDSDSGEFSSRSKRRSLSVDLSSNPRAARGQGPRCSTASAVPTSLAQDTLDGVGHDCPEPGASDRSPRRTSVELWQEARRARNSMDAQPTISTDKLTVFKAGTTTIINKAYITIKHLGSGTFGCVMLCFNVYDHRLYAVKLCRKSQFLATMTRFSQHSRLRRNSLSLGPSAGATSVLQLPVAGGAPPLPLAGGVPALPLAGGAPPLPVAGGAPPLPVAGGVPLLSTGASMPPLPTGGGGPPASTGTRPPMGGLPSLRSSSFPSAVGRPGSLAAGCGGQQQQLQCGLGAGRWHGSAGADAASGLGEALPLELRSASLSHGSAGSGLRPQHLVGPLSVVLGMPHNDGATAAAAAAAASRAPAGPSAARISGVNAAGPGHAHAGGRHSPPQPAAGAAAAAASPSMRCAPLAAPLVVAAPPFTSLGSSGSSSALTSAGGSGAFSESLLRFQTEELVKEIAILKRLQHPNVVNLVEVIDAPTTDNLLLVMEYVEGGTLEPVPRGKGQWEPVAEAEVWKYVREVLQGLEYLHSNKVVHGDLKPANLLLDRNSRKVKIADFGSSIMAGSGGSVPSGLSSRNAPGFSTPAFRSPESLMSGYLPSFEMDMWALGVCMYMWLFGRLPFTGSAPFMIYERIRTQEVTLPCGAGGVASAAAIDFMMRLLDKDVVRRLDVAAAMVHPWVCRGGAAPLPVAPPCGAGASACTVAAVGGPATRRAARPSDSCGGGRGRSGAPSGGELAGAIQTEGRVMQLVDVVFEEVHYCDRQLLISAGDAADTIYLISKGEVEILGHAGGGGGSTGCAGAVRRRRAPPGSCGGSATSGLASMGSGCNSGRSYSNACTAGSDDADDACSSGLYASGAGAGAGGDYGCGLIDGPQLGSCDLPYTAADLLDVHASDPGTSPAARASILLMGDLLDARGRAAPRPPRAGGKVLAVKGAGEALGLPAGTSGGAGGALGATAAALRAAAAAAAVAGGDAVNAASPPPRPARWKAAVRARGAVTAFRARIDDLMLLVKRHPELAPLVRDLVVQQDTDMLVAEAMRQLRLFGDSARGGDGGTISGGGGPRGATPPPATPAVMVSS